MLKENELTQNDKRNLEANKHVNHKRTKIGIELHVPNKVPYLTTRVQKYLCEDCKKIFDVYNTTEKNKKNFLKDASVEE